MKTHLLRRLNGGREVHGVLGTTRAGTMFLALVTSYIHKAIVDQASTPIHVKGLCPAHGRLSFNVT